MKTNYCEVCGGYVSGDLPVSVEPINYCTCTAKGWECPGCHKIHAPSVKECTCNRKYENQSLGNKNIPFNDNTKLFS